MDAIKIIMGNDFHFLLQNKIRNYSKNKSTDPNINLNIINAEGEQFTVLISETDFYSPLHTYVHKIINKDLESQFKLGSTTINNYLSLHSFSISDETDITLNHILERSYFYETDYIKINFNHHADKSIPPSTDDLYFATFLSETEKRTILYKMQDYGLFVNSNIMQLSKYELTLELVINLHKFMANDYHKI